MLEERPDPPVDLVAGADVVDRLARRIGQIPVDVPFAWVNAASPQPMVMTASAARMASSVSGLGDSFETSMLTSPSPR